MSSYRNGHDMVALTAIGLPVCVARLSRVDDVVGA